MYYKLTINETGRGNLKSEPEMFNVITEKFNNLQCVMDHLIDHYGKMPGGRNKIFSDDANGNAMEVGFLHSYWNRDISHNSGPWYQTDWILISKVHEEPVLLGASI